MMDKDRFRLMLKVAIVLTLASHSIAFAEDDDIDVGKLREKLSTLRSSAESKDDFSPEIRHDLQETNEKLMKKEEEILQQATSTADESTAKRASHEEVDLKPAKAIVAEESKPVESSSDIKVRGSTEIIEVPAAVVVEEKPAPPQVVEVKSARSPKEAVESLIKAQEEERKPIGPTTDDLLQVREQVEKLREENNQLKVTLDSKAKAIRSSDNSKLTCVSDLARARNDLREMNAKMMKLNNRLMIAETEVSRLSSVIKPSTRPAINLESRNSSPAEPETPRAQPARLEPATTRITQTRVAESRPLPEKVPDMPVGTVIADKAYLRTGPGKDNSPLLAVKKGTRLAIETRNGEWYRVLSPTGTRAWVASEVLAFSPDYSSSPSGTVRIKGYDPKIDEAFKIIQERRN